jgi:peptidoglycan/LPS O-acetylase OafA/YrhL
MPEAEPQRDLWIKPIDGLRAVAALTVVVGHAMAATWGLSWLPTASMAVVLFFGISGFLIFYLFELEYHRSGRIAYERYFIRRILRIWPLYFFVIAISLFILRVEDQSWRGALGLFTFTANLNMAVDYRPPPGLLALLWTICVEEQFYLVAPLFFVARLRGWGWHCLFALAIAALAGRYAFASFSRDQIANSGLYYMTISYVEVFAFSAAAGIAYVHRERLWRPMLHPAAMPVYLAAFLLLGVFWGPSTSPPYKWYSPLIYTGFGLVVPPMLLNIFVNAKGAPARTMSWKPLRFLGDLSFSIYATHYLVFFVVEKVFPKEFGDVYHRSSWLLAVVLSTSLVVSYLTWRFIERPARAMRRSVYASKIFVARFERGVFEDPSGGRGS